MAFHVRIHFVRIYTTQCKVYTIQSWKRLPVVLKTSARGKLKFQDSHANLDIFDILATPHSVELIMNFTKLNFL